MSIVHYSELTNQEKEFSSYLMEKIADYIEKKPTDRRILIVALSQICRITFCEQTPFDTETQCQEIEAFCEFLKLCSLKSFEGIKN